MSGYFNIHSTQLHNEKKLVATKAQRHKGMSLIICETLALSFLEAKKSLVYFLFFVFFLLSLISKSQENSNENSYFQRSDTGYVVHAIVEKGDTLPYVWLPWLTVQTEIPFSSRKKYAEWTRIRNNVKKVYPYAILAAAKLKEFDIILEKMPNENVRKTYLKMCEKELQKQFSAELKDLSINQGKILMKLIDRETGKTTYTIVKEMRGNFQVFMWQSLAVLFGSTMKQEYDPNGEDKLIELAIRQVEAGEF